MRLVVRLLIVVAAVFAILASSASASTSIRYGVQDDAWLRYGPGALTARLDRLQSLGVDLVRINLNWSDVELTLVSTPAWANGGQGTNYAPTNGVAFADFAMAAAHRYPFVTRWLIWN